MNKVVLTGNDLDLEQLVAVCRDHVKVEIDEKAIADVNKSREYVEEILATTFSKDDLIFHL